MNIHLKVFYSVYEFGHACQYLTKVTWSALAWSNQLILKKPHGLALQSKVPEILHIHHDELVAISSTSEKVWDYFTSNITSKKRDKMLAKWSLSELESNLQTREHILDRHHQRQQPAWEHSKYNYYCHTMGETTCRREESINKIHSLNNSSSW